MNKIIKVVGIIHETLTEARAYIFAATVIHIFSFNLCLTVTLGTILNFDSY